MNVKNLPIYARSYFKKAEGSVRSWKDFPLVKEVVLTLSFSTLLIGLFFFMVNLLGLVIAAAVMTLVLEKVFGFNILDESYFTA